MRILRWMCNETLQDEIRNENFHRRVGVALMADK